MVITAPDRLPKSGRQSAPSAGECQHTIIFSGRTFRRRSAMKLRYRLLHTLIVASLLCVSAELPAVDDLTVSVRDDTEISIRRYPAAGEDLVLWLAPEYGFRPAHERLASRLPAENIEVWQASIAT